MSDRSIATWPATGIAEAPAGGATDSRARELLAAALAAVLGLVLIFGVGFAAPAALHAAAHDTRHAASFPCH